MATVLLVGGGATRPDGLMALAAKVNTVIAADGGANVLHAAGIVPEAVIGDMDSARPELLAALPEGVVHRISEQDSTDFDKCLRHVTAPLVLGYGFLGGRVDHQLAAMTVLGRYPERRCILIGEEDVMMLCPPELDLTLPPGTRVSLDPLGPVRGQSQGLRWPIDGIDFAPDGRVGTSNEVAGPVHLRFEAAKMLLILPARSLDQLILALAATTSSWPAL
ncbi:thiamine diphosphokinase [Puniceibacterium confluentis]|uniref:thiamine diphosphokinase n=1 Tax=Puniceibacterium confluentis TaxID=1958944 RepID=UPI00356B23FB